MLTKLSRYADGIMEAVWLAAVVLVPLFFNIYSSRIFEPDKITLLRSLSLLILAAWVVKLIEEGFPKWESSPSGRFSLKTFLQIPLIGPVIFLAFVYLVATVFSVVPRISFFGSYQRLQGTYSTLSYLVIFAAITVNLRRRAQVERLITVAILVSLPVSMYGVLQRYQIDPVPWAGNVSRRIASNMGNSIFVAAYLIMVNALTLARIAESFMAILKEESRGWMANFIRATIYVFIAAMQLIAIYLSRSRGPFLGWLAGSFFFFVLYSLYYGEVFLSSIFQSLIHIKTRGIIRITILIFEVVVLYLGRNLETIFYVLIGLVVIEITLFLGIPLLYKLYLRLSSETQNPLRRIYQFFIKRGMTFGLVGVAAAVGLFLVLLSLPGGALQSLSTSPWIGRFGRIFDTEERTSRVRILIWQGASELVLPHEPLDFPDGSQDTFNLFRPLIGYGPESMHVAYNKYFPPELARIENRNASPDRSHNETWDALVTTGGLGLISYLVLFGAVFYYALQWLGLVNGRRQRILFFSLTLSGGMISTVGFVLWQGIEFFGVGLPFGMILGLTAYLAITSLYIQVEIPATEKGAERILIIMALLAVFVAHFVEINFGIAIAATRIYFWVFVGLLLVVGYIFPRHNVYKEDMSSEAVTKEPVRRSGRKLRGKVARKRRRVSRDSQTYGKSWKREAIIGGIITALILVALGYDFINVQRLPISSPAAIWTSFTNLPNKGGVASFGVLTMMVTIWLSSGLLFVSESARDEPNGGSGALGGLVKMYLSALGITLGLSIGLAFIYWLFHAGGLIRIGLQAGNAELEIIDRVMVQSLGFEGLLTGFYLFIFLVLFALGRVLPDEWPVRSGRRSTIGPYVGIGALSVAMVVAVFTNLRVIQADMIFKIADPLSRQGQHQAAISLFDRANDRAINEDHYYLFLGKTHLEYAQTLMDNPDQQINQIERAEDSLVRAQEINPLNTDHTANLARLYRWWAGISRESNVRQERGKTSSNFYDRALTMSPNNAGLWGELASLYIAVIPDSDIALEILMKALEVDPVFDGTHAMLGDYYVQRSRDLPAEGKMEALTQAADHYEQAIGFTRKDAKGARYNYRIALAGVYTELGDYPASIKTYQEALEESPGRKDRWRVEEVIASLYVQIGDRANALAYATNLLSTVPDTEKARIQNFINQLQASP
jgi:tetratricopeptide (TPR) repeat protein